MTLGAVWATYEFNILTDIQADLTFAEMANEKYQ